ncbi:MAG: hypothetical protein SOZ95_01645 [Bacilli bacterium]|nr:hypothetical protein [Bacilli bacterium]MDY3800727.1 hypothetical protein [Bacilli bacterium]
MLKEMINYDIFNNTKEAVNKSINLKCFHLISTIIFVIIFLVIVKFKIYVSNVFLHETKKDEDIYLILDNEFRNIYVNDINYNDKIRKHTSSKNKYYVTIFNNGFEDNERIKIKIEEETTIMKYLINYVRKDLFNERT